MKVEVQHTMDGNTKVGYKFPEGIWGIPGLDNFAWGGHVDNESCKTKAEIETYSADGNKAELEMEHTWTPAEKTHELNFEKKVSTEDLGGFTAHAKVR